MRSPGTSVAIGALLLASACVPYVTRDYKISAPNSSVAHSCGMGSDPLYFKLEDVRVYLRAPRQPGGAGTVGMSIEIPAGHTVRLADGAAALSVTPDSSSWSASIVSKGGYRYIDPESGQTFKDPEGGDPTRDLVGSTWNTHRLGEHLHSMYHFEIGSEVPWPEGFNLRVPPIIIDGARTELPTVTFLYGAHRGVAGIGCS
jgi:hypothetical protein